MKHTAIEAFLALALILGACTNGKVDYTKVGTADDPAFVAACKSSKSDHDLVAPLASSGGIAAVAVDQFAYAALVQRCKAQGVATE